MIPYEEFYYGTSTNYKLTNGQKIKRLLCPQSLDILTNLRLKKEETTRRITLSFPTEDVVTVTQLTRPTDRFTRDGIDNHTIIIRISDILKQYPPENLVSHLFKPLEATT